MADLFGVSLTGVRRNARQSADRLLSESTIIEPAVDSGDVEIVTAFFHLDGEVEFE